MESSYRAHTAYYLTKSSVTNHTNPLPRVVTMSDEDSEDEDEKLVINQDQEAPQHAPQQQGKRKRVKQKAVSYLSTLVCV